MTRVLVVDDSAFNLKLVSATLAPAGYEIVTVSGGAEALSRVESIQPNLIILDVMMPDLNGYEVCRQLRRNRATAQLPILMLTANESIEERINGFEAGADDYMIKPFGVPELLARMRVALRHAARAAPRTESVLVFGELRIDLVRREVHRNEAAVHLTPHEYGLFAVLARHAGQVVTYRQLLREVWGPAFMQQTHYLRVYMGHLRQKLEADPARPRWLITEAGVGYRLRDA